MPHGSFRPHFGQDNEDAFSRGVLSRYVPMQSKAVRESRLPWRQGSKDASKPRRVPSAPGLFDGDPARVIALRFDRDPDPFERKRQLFGPLDNDDGAA
jgi:hypothetical protein